jgi:hypothetical protein
MRRWVQASSGPTADAVIEHPAPDGAWIEADHIPIWLAPDPGGIAPRAGTVEYLLDFGETPIQHSPITNWNPGSPYPGPPAKTIKYVDLDSARWWGRTGQGQLVWSQNAEFSGDLPPQIPSDMAQHVDNFQGFWGGYPSLARNRPTAFGDQVPSLNPVANALNNLAPG